MTRHEEIYSKYKNGETDMRKLGREYGVTQERIRQVIEKQESQMYPLKKAITELTYCENKLKLTAKDLIGKIDNDTLCEYNDLVKQLTVIINKFKTIENNA